MRWFTSDLHFGHENIIKFCKRPFADASEMNIRIADEINELVTPGDELWILGDLALGKFDETLGLSRRLTAGRVVLVAGNHDRCHPVNGPKHERWIDVYRDRERSGLDEVILTNTTLELLDGTTVNVSHFPYEPQPMEHRVAHGKSAEDRFEAWRPVDDGNWLLCGHIHDKWRQNGRQVNVGIDAWQRPVSELEILELIHAGPAFRHAVAA
jgi:calcineurin-like phosphoesterase family protein